MKPTYPPLTSSSARASEAASLSYFHSLPWTSRILSHPDYTYLPMLSRLPKPSKEDAFFAETLKSHDTISHIISAYRRPSGPGEPIREIKTLMHLGEQLNGWATLIHGGVISFLCDELMGYVLGVNGQVLGDRSPLPRQTAVTGELRVKYKKAVNSPIVVCLTARLERAEGRKHFMKAEVTDEHGTVLVEAESLYIYLKPENQQKL